MAKPERCALGAAGHLGTMTQGAGAITACEAGPQVTSATARVRDWVLTSVGLPRVNARAALSCSTEW